MKLSNRVYMTQRDFDIISSLLEKVNLTGACDLDRLADELDRAELVTFAHELPGNVVVMQSIVQYVDLHTGTEKRVQIVFPNEVDIYQGRISILSAVGSALIGLSEGDEIEWPMPNGNMSTLRILNVEQASV